MVSFHHGAELAAVSLFNCDDKDEERRFHIAIAAQLFTKLLEATESMAVDGLHIIVQGVLVYQGRIRMKGQFLGLMEFVGGFDATECTKTSIATAMTFVACTYSTPEFLQQVLATRRFPTIASQMRTVSIQLRLSRIVRRVIVELKWWHDTDWPVEAQNRYRDALLTVGSGTCSKSEEKRAFAIIKSEVSSAQVKRSLHEENQMLRRRSVHNLDVRQDHEGLHQLEKQRADQQEFDTPQAIPSGGESKERGPALKANVGGFDDMRGVQAVLNRHSQVLDRHSQVLADLKRGIEQLLACQAANQRQSGNRLW